MNKVGLILLLFLGSLQCRGMMDVKEAKGVAVDLYYSPGSVVRLSPVASDVPRGLVQGSDVLYISMDEFLDPEK